MKQISLTLQDSEYQKFLDLLTNLSSVKILKTKNKSIELDENLDYPSMTEKEIIERVALADEQIKNGDTISHDEVVKQFKKW